MGNFFRFYSTRIGASTGNFGLISLKGKNIGKFVLRHSKRADGLSGEKNRVEQDRAATVEETGFQRGGQRLPFFSIVWEPVSKRFQRASETGIDKRLLPHPITLELRALQKGLPFGT